jgi:hypothetical protein
MAIGMPFGVVAFSPKQFFGWCVLISVERSAIIQLKIGASSHGDLSNGWRTACGVAGSSDSSSLSIAVASPDALSAMGFGLFDFFFLLFFFPAPGPLVSQTSFCKESSYPHIRTRRDEVWRLSRGHCARLQTQRRASTNESGAVPLFLQREMSKSNRRVALSGSMDHEPLVRKSSWFSLQHAAERGYAAWRHDVTAIDCAKHGRFRA